MCQKLVLEMSTSKHATSAQPTHRKLLEQLRGHVDGQVCPRHEFLAAYATLSREGEHQPVAR